MKRFKQLMPSREALLARPWLRRLGPLLQQPKLWRWSRRGVALGVSIGVFFGLLIPIAQIPLAATAAVLLRANLPAAVASTLVTNPVTFAPIYFAAYQLGSKITGNGDAAAASNPPPLLDRNAAGAPQSAWAKVTQLGAPLFVGLAVTATFFGIASYALISLVWYWRVLRKRRRRIPIA